MSLTALIICAGIFVVSFVAAFLVSIKKAFKRGQQDIQNKQVEENVKESLEIKKQEEVNRNTPLDRIRERMQKYTRD